MNREISAKENVILRTIVVSAMIVFVAALRVVPHPWNLAPIGAVALFSGAMIGDRRIAFALPLIALFLGDIFIGFHKLIPFVYASFLVSVAIGGWLKDNRTVMRIGGATLLGAIQFFIVSNFAMWAVGGFYPRTFAGLTSCFIAAIPFFWNTLAGDALYVVLLFGSFALAERLFPPLHIQLPTHNYKLSHK